MWRRADEPEFVASDEGGAVGEEVDGPNAGRGPA